MSSCIICLLKGDLLDHAVAMQYWSEGFVLSSLASAALCSRGNRLVADLAALAVFHSQDSALTYIRSLGEGSLTPQTFASFGIRSGTRPYFCQFPE
jgi:hypothetical protein